MSVFIAKSMFNEALEVGRADKQASETCDICPGYGNEAKPLKRILLYPKTIFWF